MHNVDESPRLTWLDDSGQLLAQKFFYKHNTSGAPLKLLLTFLCSNSSENRRAEYLNSHQSLNKFMIYTAEQINKKPRNQQDLRHQEFNDVGDIFFIKSKTFKSKTFFLGEPLINRESW